MNKRSNTTKSRFAALFFGLAVGVLLGMTSASSAHTASTYVPKEWAADVYYYFGDIDSPLDTLTAKTSIHTGDDEWNSNSGMWFDFINSGAQDSSVVWTGSGCTTGSGTALWIVSASISPLGIESTCSTSTTITRSVIRFDDTRSNWYVGSSSSVPSGQFDLRTVAVHEFGHAAGWTTHWDGSGEDCSTTARETMCPVNPSGTSYMRSIESHENHTMDSAY